MDIPEVEPLERLQNGQCVVCLHRGFVLGPRSGASINIECANRSCRSRYNVVSIGGKILFAENIESEADGGLPWPTI